MGPGGGHAMPPPSRRLRMPTIPPWLPQARSEVEGALAVHLSAARACCRQRIAQRSKEILSVGDAPNDIRVPTQLLERRPRHAAHRIDRGIQLAQRLGLPGLLGYCNPQQRRFDVAVIAEKMLSRHRVAQDRPKLSEVL